MGVAVVKELAPAKINLSLHLGPLRRDGRHELLSVMQSITLADRLELEDAEREEVLCAGVEGPNLAAAAIAAFRAASGWDGPPQRLLIDKRIPVAAGLGGGSADAAAALRMLARRSGIARRAAAARARDRARRRRARPAASRARARPRRRRADRTPP